MIKESPLDPDAALYRRVVLAGDYWIHVVRKGERFRIVDLEGNQAADTLFYNAADPAEHYSACDTIREQGNIYLSTGTVLRSDLCRPMLTITADTVGRHDTLGGACATESNMVRYAIEKRYMHACRQSFVKAITGWGRGLDKRDIGHNINFFMNVPVTSEGGLTFEDGVSAPGKYVEMRAEMDVLALAELGRGMNKRDLASNINFFMNVPLTPDGGLSFADGVSAPGRYVEMRAETDVLVLISNCPQLNNPCNAYNPTPVRLLIWEPAA